MPSPAPKPRVLVVDDDAGVRGIIEEALSTADFEVETAVNGADGLEKIARVNPDLVLMDVEMPVMNGWEALAKLKADPLLRHVPVLMITSRSLTEDKVRGLEIGANDYITKPFDIVELIARARAALRNTRSELEANPLSRLPGNVAIERDILRRLESGAKFCVLYADINDFKAFNDRYGYLRGDELIRKTAELLLSNARPGVDFVGHIGGDDFIVNTSLENGRPLCESVIKGFDALCPELYDAEDRKNGFIEVPDRLGVKTRFPLAGIAIGGVSNELRPLTSLGQVSQIGAEMKKFAKRAGKSFYAFDRRKD